MIKKSFLWIIVITSLIFICFEIVTFFQTMLYSEVAMVPGEEDIVIRNKDSACNELTFTCNVDWGEDIIPEMLKILDEKDIKITFFVSGKWAKNNPYLLRKMYISGHEIQNHGYRHKLCSKISSKEVKEEILSTEDAINNLIGIKTTVFAPPAGDYDKKTVELCREMGYLLSLWSSDTIDWKEGSTSNIITERILQKPLKGAIILMHPKEETVKALPKLIDEIQNQGIKIVSLNELIH